MTHAQQTVLDEESLYRSRLMPSPHDGTLANGPLQEALIRLVIGVCNTIAEGEMHEADRRRLAGAIAAALKIAL